MYAKEALSSDIGCDFTIQPLKAMKALQRHPLSNPFRLHQAMTPNAIGIFVVDL
jgi:hypothetical protein